ncbi:protein of unknown function DUF1659 [Desulforamulus reducens MI-1]|uniref:DUF1659 domain-containing protein n=1 Tax=Desulforamulus reducens (strain ATCC BAA-1160 / DSM 100696 / MI-1) TaxID=349161 RepID=A4J6R4_DESRM|nr:DUF1659 domain-containing protein [Desulforamulus reducens]ABO50767.1 protein of unknown function DUF1659 [Desulforamulus reducens MI-1]
MAVVKQPYSCSIKLRYQKGVNASGDPIFVNTTYSKAKVTATDQDLYDVATAINSLQNNVLLGVYRADDSELINQ